MTKNCRSEFSNLFIKDQTSFENLAHRVDFSKLRKRKQVEDAIRNLETLDVRFFNFRILFLKRIKSLETY